MPNQQINQGEVSSEWKENPRKLSQKDADAGWSKKNGERHFGHKNHINVDVEYDLSAITGLLTPLSMTHNSFARF
ncbi:MAG: hypothetical protein MH252_21680 [Thermosynechococcaceae cyanobacterium MS004]|nr:hypothetical protein [Thermosynechococcaceae cyanobacterium MS004]